MHAAVTLYTNPMSRGRIARWMLEETGVDYAVEVLHYGTSMKAPAYLAINPMGKVPAIVHDRATVTECGAICAYLADAFPAAGLAPPVHRRADYYRWLLFTAGPVEASVSNRALGYIPSPEQQRMIGYGSFEAVMDTLEAFLEQREFVTGDVFSAADVYLGAQIIWGLQFGTIDARPAFERYARRLRERAAYARAQAADDALVAAGAGAG